MTKMEEDEYKIEGKYKSENKNINNKIERTNFKHSVSNENNISPSEEEIFRVKNNLTIKEGEDIKTNDYIDKKKYTDNANVNVNDNAKNSNNDNIKIKEYKGFLGKSLDWINYIFHEIPLFWKKEELVKGYDANGNIVYRPKNKIPTKNNNNVDIDKMNAENEANSAGVDYSTKGINYGVLFN